MPTRTDSTRTNTLPLSVASDHALRLGLTLLFVGLMILSSFSIHLHIPGYVPTTLQTLAAAIAVITLGSRHGSAAIGIYLLLGIAGIPVFSDQTGGISVIMGTTGGFIIGFLLMQPTLGFLLNRTHKNPALVTASIITGFALVFVIGVPWFKFTSGKPWPEALALSLLPFLITEAIKITIALAAASVILPWRTKRGWR